MHNDIIRLDRSGQRKIGTVGGKAAGLAQLMYVDGVTVPDGFCVSTAAYARMLATEPVLSQLIDRLSGDEPDAPDVVGTCAQIGSIIQQVALPDDLTAAIADSVREYGEVAGWTVRSSATPEDAPTTSFAGQLDSYLNVRGSAVAGHVRSTGDKWIV